MEQPGRYIWCTLVFGGDDYARGAAVVAKSLRDVGTKYQIWCMISEDVTETAKYILNQLFDKLVVVPLITHKCVPMKSKKQNQIYGSWIHNSFTKCNVLNPEFFPEVEKIMLLDADMQFKKNCDHLFELNTPAMTWSSPWAYPYAVNPTTKGSSYNKGNFNPYYSNTTGELAHGALVPRKSIELGFKKGILGLACMVLVTPSKPAYEKMLEILNRKTLYGTSTCISGFDEQLFAEVFLAMNYRIYNIHQQYNWIVGKNNWLLNGEQPSTQQFYNGKPWRGIKSPEDVNNSEWDDVREWWAVARRIINDLDDDHKLWFFD